MHACMHTYIHIYKQVYILTQYLYPPPKVALYDASVAALGLGLSPGAAELAAAAVASLSASLHSG